MTLYSDSNHEIIYCIMELLPTVEEGLLHMIGQLEELRLEDSAVMFRDVVEAISGIAKNVMILMSEQDGAEILQFTREIMEVISTIIAGYEVSNLVSIYIIIVNQLFPAFSMWRQQLENILQPSIMS